MLNAPGRRKNIERDVFQPWPQKNPQHQRCEIPTGFSGTEPHSCRGHVWSGCVRAAFHQRALWATPQQRGGVRGRVRRVRAGTS